MIGDVRRTAFRRVGPIVPQLITPENRNCFAVFLGMTRARVGSESRGSRCESGKIRNFEPVFSRFVRSCCQGYCRQNTHAVEKRFRILSNFSECFAYLTSDPSRVRAGWRGNCQGQSPWDLHEAGKLGKSRGVMSRVFGRHVGNSCGIRPAKSSFPFLDAPSSLVIPHELRKQ